MNLSSQRIWCYLCECEVYFPTQANNRSRLSFSTTSSIESQQRLLHFYQDNFQGEGVSSISGSDYDDEEFDFHGRLNGLIGLKNIANTCYMNAALQALSNSPPLTRYFLKCGNFVQKRTVRSKVGLAKCYTRLIKEIWMNERRGYIVPDEIIRGISTIHPMFRGYQQHDTQEFLRCFMDQLHEELKEITKPAEITQVMQQQHHFKIDENEDSVSEAEYETCDSGVSEQSSLSDEVSMSSKRIRKISRSPSPPLSQRQNIASSASSSQSVIMNRTGSTTSLNQENSNNNNNQQPKIVHRSIISDVFDGKLLSSVQCLTCDRVSTREETFQDLSLPIPGRDHLSVLHQAQNPPPLNINLNQNSGGASCTNVVRYQESWVWWIFVWLKSWFWGPAVSLHDCMGAFFSADELKG
jgi:ubiquitin carboxyl-terminal hydrolase 20/33